MGSQSICKMSKNERKKTETEIRVKNYDGVFLPLINAFVRTSEKWFHAVDLSETNNTDIEVKAACTRLQKLNTKFNLHQSLWCEIESIQSKTSISNGINMQLHLLAIQNATQSRWRIKKSIGKTIWFRFAIDYATNENSFFFFSL